MTAEIRANAEVWTYQDLVEHLLDMFNEERVGRPLRTARRAAREAMRDLHMSHRWCYYNAERIFSTSAQHATGTIEYDHTGGSSERLVTLSDSTWPSDVRYHKIILNDTHYPIDTVIDTTNLTLSADENPGADLAAGTGYKVYREAYPLPSGFGEFGNLIDITNNRTVPLIGTDLQVTRKIRAYDTPDTPWQVAIRNAEEFLNSLSFVFVPPPSSVIKYQFTYTRVPRPLQTELNDTGTFAGTAGATTGVLTGSSLSAKHVGSVIRIGDDVDPPTNVFGGLDGADNVFTDQAVILGISGTTLTLDTALSATHTASLVTVSDPLDIEINVMLSALQRLAEAKYSVLSKRETKERREREELAMTALILAKERDNKAAYSPAYAPYDPFSRVNVTDEV